MAKIFISVFEKYPDLRHEWCFPKNNQNEVYPETTSYGTGKKVWWVCELGHEWIAPPYARKRGACPYCSGYRAIPGETDLMTLFPKIGVELVDENYSATQIRPNMGTKVLWECPVGHNYEAAPYSRMRGDGCPYCSSHKVLAGFNDLQSRYPSIAVELFDPNYSASQLSYASNKKVQWKCPNNHVYKTQVHHRTTKNTGCRRCSLGTTSYIEQKLFMAVENKFSGVGTCLSGAKIDVPVGKNNYGTVDILLSINNLKFVIEYDGSYWHRNKKNIDEQKTNTFLKSGYMVVRIRESCREKVLPLVQISHDNLYQVEYTYTPRHDGIEEMLEDVYGWIQYKCGNIVSTPVRIEELV